MVKVILLLVEVVVVEGSNVKQEISPEAYSITNIPDDIQFSPLEPQQK